MNTPGATSGKAPLNRKHTAVIIIFIMIVFLIMSVSLVYERFDVRGRAVENGAISYDNSYLFASPLSSCADGVSRIRVTVFLLNTKGLGVAGQKVSLVLPGGLSQEEVQNTSDNLGKSYFDLATTAGGKYKIKATAAGLSIPQDVEIDFREPPCGLSSQ